MIFQLIIYISSAFLRIDAKTQKNLVHFKKIRIIFGKTSKETGVILGTMSQIVIRLDKKEQFEMSKKKKKQYLKIWYVLVK